MKPTYEEQETIINISRTENTATIYTSDSRYMTKLDKLVENNPDEWKCTGQEKQEGDVVAKYYECQAKYISFRSRTVKRELTEEQKEILRERMKKMQNDRNR